MVKHALPLPPLPRVAGPEPPRYDRWPVAMRSAWRLSGALVPCGPGLRGLGWPETPGVRLAAIAGWLGSEYIATHLTAAWVWGAARQPGDPLQASVPPGRRSPPGRRAGLRLYALRGAAAESLRVGGLAVTTPSRTIFDLLHDPDGFGISEAVACRLLLRLVEGGAADITRRLEDHRRPMCRTARARFAEISSEASPPHPPAPYPPLMR